MSRIKRHLLLATPYNDPAAVAVERNGHSTNGKSVSKSPKSEWTKERFQVANEFADKSARSVDTTAQAVWFHLWREVKPPDAVATISHSQLADKIGVSRRTIIRAISQLESAGLVTVVNRSRIGQPTPSTYRVHGQPEGQIQPATEEAI